jgi:branched-chain amino acid transport system permease protein
MISGGIITEQLVNGLVLGCIYGLIAIGYTMVYGIIGMINFAHGDVYMVSAYLTAIFFALIQFIGIDSVALNLTLTLTFTMFITGLYGWTIERLAYRPLRYAARLAPLISAIGMSVILQNYVRLSQSARSQGIPVLIEKDFVFHIGHQQVQISMLRIAIILVSIISMILLSVLIKKSALGRAMRATQQDITMAHMLGININRIIPLVFVMGAVMAAIAGVMVTLNYGSFDFSIGFVIGIKAFTAAVLGGIGSLPGAMLGGILLGMAESLFSGFVDVDYKDVFAFAILIIVLIFKPSGLLGTPEVEKV